MAMMPVMPNEISGLGMTWAAPQWTLGPSESCSRWLCIALGRSDSAYLALSHCTRYLSALNCHQALLGYA